MTIQVKNLRYVYFLPRHDNMYLTFTSTYIGAFPKTVVHSGEQMISSFLCLRQGPKRTYPFRIASGHWRHLVQRTDGLGFLDIKGP